jgi:hypothetical protein
MHCRLEPVPVGMIRDRDVWHGLTQT